MLFSNLESLTPDSLSVDASRLYNRKPRFLVVKTFLMTLLIPEMCLALSMLSVTCEKIFVAAQILPPVIENRPVCVASSGNSRKQYRCSVVEELEYYPIDAGDSHKLFS